MEVQKIRQRCEDLKERYRLELQSLILIERQKYYEIDGLVIDSATYVETKRKDLENHINELNQLLQALVGAEEAGIEEVDIKLVRERLQALLEGKKHPLRYDVK